MFDTTNPEITLLRSKVEGELRANSKTSKCYLTLKEKKAMQYLYGESAFILFDYLLDMTKHRNPDVSINGLRETTGWSVSKVKRIRKILLDAELLYTIHLASSKGSKINVTYLGKNLVGMAKLDEYKRGYLYQVECLAKKDRITEGEAHKILFTEICEPKKDTVGDLRERFIKSNFTGDLEKIFQEYKSHPSYYVNDVYEIPGE